MTLSSSHHVVGNINHVTLFQVVCVGSIEELAELSGVKVTDLHREK